MLRTNNVARRFNLSTRMVRYLVEWGLLPARRHGIRLYTYEETDVVQVGRQLGYIKGRA
jgi:DNA-binding transcriptional MerR regulator